MKSQYLIISIFLFFCFSLKAEEKFYERAFVHTDKDCYIAGEDIFLKFYLINNNFQPSDLSKVGYVEICDTEKPQMQLKIALKKGHGTGKVKIPTNIPSGIYILSAYTRYMRNEGENVLFKKQLAIINAGQQIPDTKRFELIEKYENLQKEEKNPVNISIRTDRNEYGNRKDVVLHIDNIPDNTADLVISVSRNDSIAFVSEINTQEWLKQVRDTFSFSQQWISEYEGHIITGRISPDANGQQLLTNIAFLGKDIRYFMGQQNPQKEIINFYASDIYGKQQIVTSVVSTLYDAVPYRLDLLNPFYESLPDSLPLLQIYPNEKQLLERYIGAQIQTKLDYDLTNNFNNYLKYNTIQPDKTYNLDEYTRFETIDETILEFITRLRVARIRGNKVISAYLEEAKQFSLRTLVLLDGIPVYNHEDILKYNPMYIKIVDIYDGRYMFSNENYECIVSFITREGDLPLFQLGEGSQLLNYECPQFPASLKIPDYSSDDIRNSRKPDFRHTLYWNPLVEFTKAQPVNLSFYTSDLCGEFKIKIEGITTDGKIIQGSSYFQVNSSQK